MTDFTMLSDAELDAVTGGTYYSSKNYNKSYNTQTANGGSIKTSGGDTGNANQQVGLVNVGGVAVLSGNAVNTGSADGGTNIVS